MKTQERKIVIVTGATSGIGLSCARLLHRQGYTVYGIGRRAVEEDFVCYRADVNDDERMKEIVDEVVAKEGSIYALVNNAGMGIAGAVEQTTGGAMETIVNTNLLAVTKLTALVLPHLQKGGRVVNISSVGGIVPLPYQALYSATKAAVEIFSRALAMELRPSERYCSAVLPGDTKTGFTAARVSEGDDEQGKRSIAKMAHDEQHGASPESVASAVLKCVSRRRPPLRVTVGWLSKLEVVLIKFLPLRLVQGIIYRIYGK